MTDYASGQLTFTGLGSGTDFGTMIEKLIQVESRHKTQLELWKAGWETRIKALEELNNSLVSLRSTLTGMDTVNKFMAKDSSSSDASVLSALAESAAEEGSHHVEVFQLARNSIWMSAGGVATKNTAITTTNATFSYTYDDPKDKAGPKTINLSVPANASLQNLMNMINTDPDNPGVRASIVSDGSTFHLQVRGMDLGEDANLTINSSFGALGSYNEIQTNADALLKVDGWPSASNAFIRSSSNTVTDAIPGVSLTLKNTGSSTVSVDINQEKVVENVWGFVKKVNEVRTLFMEMTKVDTTKNEGSTMTGNYAVQLVSSNLRNATSGLAVGFQYYNALTNSGDKFASFSHIGIMTEADEGSALKGLLVLDEDKLREALASDPQAVAELFAAKDLGGQTVNSGNFKYHSHVTGITKPGVWDFSYTVSGGVITSASLGGMPVDIDNVDKTITVTGGDAKGLAMEILDTSQDGTFGGKAQIKQGKIGQLSDLLKDYGNAKEGPMHIVANNYEDIIKNIDKKIEYEETRLSKKATELRLKFARLEALLGQYDQQNTALGNAIKQLESS